MGTSVTRTKSATWLVAPPDSDADVGEVLAARLEAIGAGRGSSFVRELVDRALEAARRSAATGADLAAALVTAVLDAIDAAARTPSGAPDAGDSLRAHIEDGAACSADPAIAAEWLPRILGAVEGIVEQCGDDPEHAALVTATMMLVDVGGGLEQRFGCIRHGAALVSAVESAADHLTTCEPLAGCRALVDANAAFERSLDLYRDGDAAAAIWELRRSRSLFVEAGLRVEAAVALAEQAHIESEDLDEPDTALAHWDAARVVLVEHGRDVEVARADRDVAFAIEWRSGAAAAEERVGAAADVFERHALVRDLVLCDVTLACLARRDGRVLAAGGHLGRAAARLQGLGLDRRASQLRALAERGGMPPG